MDGSPERGRMEGLFGRGGAAVTTVSTTVEALAAFDQAKPELVISRVGVSADGAEGLELIRAIRTRPAELGGRTPAIAVAEACDAPDRQSALAAGFTDHLVAPSDFDGLLATIARCATEIDAMRRAGSTPRSIRKQRVIPTVRRPEIGFGNAVLDALETHASGALAGAVEFVELGRDATLSNVGDAPRSIYFPCGAVVSLLRIAESGKTVEVSPIGPEGFVGVSGLIGPGRASHWSRVLVGGGAWRVGRHELAAAFDVDTTLRSLLLGAVYEQFAEISLVAACTRTHTIDQQVARWLLTVCDRAGTSDLPLTHERVADRLGTRRSSISLALEAYRRAGHVDLRRGRILVTRRAGLEAIACECYQGIRSDVGRRHAA